MSTNTTTTATAPTTAAHHTPGPWTYSRMRLPPNATDRRCGFVVNGPETSANADTLPTRICDLRTPAGIDGFQEGESNARLIAAAPDLLDALRECITDNNALAFASQDFYRAKQRLIAITNIAKEAIARIQSSPAN